jgi:hypothetical protein
MSAEQLLLLTYIIFIWMVMLHTFEEIGHGVFETKIGTIQFTRQKYLLAASLLNTINMITFTLILLQIPLGYYFGLFTSGIIGVFQAFVHSIGFIKEKNHHGLGVGFYSSIPLAITGIILLLQIITRLQK